MDTLDIIENFWLARARSLTGEAETEAALDKLRPAVQHLSDLFTTERPAAGFPDYAATPELLVAYGLFFFPQSYVRARIALEQAVRFRGWHPAAGQGGAAERVLRVLDLGSGAGPCGLAAATVLRELAPGSPVALTALDHSNAALASLRELAQAGQGVSVETRVVNLRRIAEKPGGVPVLSGAADVIIVGFAANELFGGDGTALREWMASLRPCLAPGGLLVVLEPALRETALPLQRAADSLTAEGVFHRWAPDLGDAPFPLSGDGKFHPHEVRRWSPPESLQFLNRTLYRETGVLKFAYTALGVDAPAPLPEEPLALRLVSPLEVLKGRVVCSVVTAEGRRFSVEIPTRALSKSKVKTFAATFERGDVFGVQSGALVPLGVSQNQFRVAMSAIEPLFRGNNE